MHTLLYNCFSHSTFRHSFIIIFFLEFLKNAIKFIGTFFFSFFYKSIWTIMWAIYSQCMISIVWFSVFYFWTMGELLDTRRLINILWAPLWLAAAFLSIRGCIKCCYVSVSKYWECTVLVWWKFYVGNLFLYSHLN